MWVTEYLKGDQHIKKVTEFDQSVKHQRPLEILSLGKQKIGHCSVRQLQRSSELLLPILYV
jgi:hypothetical protein